MPAEFRGLAERLRSTVGSHGFRAHGQSRHRGGNERKQPAVLRRQTEPTHARIRRMCTCANLNPWLCRRVRFEPGTHSSNGCSNATSLGLICRCVVLALDSTGNTRHSGHCNGVSQVAVTVRRREAIPTAVVAITYSELSGARIQGRNCWKLDSSFADGFAKTLNRVRR